jgi:hypothetical protein
MPASNVLWPVPLQRLTPWYGGQIGVPGTDSDRGLRLDSNGKILYVDPNHVDANDNRDGTNPDSPLRTVAAALTKCRAYMGDVIVVAFNADWTYSNLTLGRPLPVTESVVVTVPGVRIVGLAPSSSLGVPWFPTGDNATCITVRAMDVLIEGFCFWNTGHTGTTAILAEWGTPTPPPVVVYSGENLTVRHNFFYHLAYGVRLDYTWNCFVEGNYFQGCTTAAVHNPSVYGEPDYLTVRGNVFTSNTADLSLPDCDYELIEGNRFMSVTAAITLLTGTHNTIHANTIEGNPAGTNNYINLTGGSNNLVSGNWLACTIAQYDTTCSGGAGSGSWVNNLCSNGPTTAPPT